LVTDKKWVSVSQLYGEICRRYEVKRGDNYELPRPGFRKVDRVFTFVSDFPRAQRPADVPDEELDGWIDEAVDRLVDLCMGRAAGAGEEPEEPSEGQG
jgi:hypothetical protein